MSDVSQAVSQEEVADSLVAEPEETQADAATGTEEQAEVSEEQQPVEEAEGAEEDADWLPDEQEKVFPDEVIAKYANRYGLTPEQLEANPSLRHLVHDKINSDILIRQQQNQPQFEPETREQEPQQKPIQQQQPLSLEQWRVNASQFLRQNGLVNPEVAKSFAADFMKSFGVEQLPENMNAEAFTETMSLYATNLVNGLMPHYFQAPSPSEGKNMFQYLMEQNYPSLGDVAERTQYNNAWDAVRGNNQNLPEYGTKEFRQMMEKAVQAVPGLDSMKFAGLSPRENSIQQYRIALQIAQGQRPNPELVKQAVQTGQRLARQSQSRKQAGNLGAGNSKTQFSQQSDDDFFSNAASWNEFIDRRL